MLFLNRKKVLRSELGFIYKSSQCKWWLKNQSFVDLAKKIGYYVKQLSNDEDEVISDIEILKRAEKKIVLRIFHNNTEKSSHDERSFIVKIFFLKQLSHKLKYCRYGLDEAVNLITAKKRGIKSSAVFGYANLYDRCRLVNASIILMEDLCHLKPIGDMMKNSSDEQRGKLFMSTIPLIISLYKANCNHIDVNAGAVMLSGCEPDNDIALIDFQHAKFYETRRTEILAYECAYFAGCCKQWVRDSAVYDWFDQILRDADIVDIGEKSRLKRRFDFYFPDSARLLSRKHRKKIY